MIDPMYLVFATTPLILSSFGTAIGQGIISKKTLDSMDMQPESADAISKIAIIGMAVSETAAITGFIVTLMLLNESALIEHTLLTNLAAAGIAIAMGASGLCAGIASSMPVKASTNSLARQPFMQHKILNMMLITQTLIMTPNIFGMLISLLIKAQLPNVTTWTQAMQLFASGLSIGIGGIGPSIGLSLFAYDACRAIGINKKSFSKIMPFTFICEAIIETPVIFSLLIALMILNNPSNQTSDIIGWQYIASALCIGLSTISPGINAGKTGAAACRQIALHLEQYSGLSKITLLALAMIDSFAIYGLLISIVILLF